MSDWKAVAFRHQPSGLVVQKMRDGKWRVYECLGAVTRLCRSDKFYGQGDCCEFLTAGDAIEAAMEHLERKS